MNLKEAFRYQNRLQSFMEQAQFILDDVSNVTRVEKTYIRHKVNPDAEDEKVTVCVDCEYYEQITDLARFLVYMLEQKQLLYTFIRKAKNSLELDLDSEVSLNATRQSLARTFRTMNDQRSGEQLIADGGTGYRFNTDGNQTVYRCDVRKVTTINFDRKEIRSLLSHLNQASDQISTKIDLCLVTTEVDYQPPFDVNDSFSEAFDVFVGVSDH